MCLTGSGVGGNGDGVQSCTRGGDVVVPSSSGSA
jgi:hypothetical protein